jgi:hypothetical protein
VRDVRSLPALWPLRQRRHAVVLCGVDRAPFDRCAAELAALAATLVVADEDAALAAALGRPSVTVADRFGTVGLHEREASVERVLAELESFALACPECGPQAWGDPGA